MKNKKNRIISHYGCYLCTVHQRKICICRSDGRMERPLINAYGATITGVNTMDDNMLPDDKAIELERKLVIKLNF